MTDMSDLTRDEALELLGTTIDRVDSLSYGLQMPVPAGLHVDALKDLLPEITRDLKRAYVVVAGDDPWEMHP